MSQETSRRNPAIGLPLRVTKARPLERRFRYQLLGPLPNVLLRSPLRGLYPESLTLARVTDLVEDQTTIARVSLHRLPHTEETYIVARGDWWRPLLEAGTLELLVDGEWVPVTVSVTERRRKVAEFARDYVDAHGRPAGTDIGVLVEGDGDALRAHYLRALEGTVLLTIESRDGGKRAAAPEAPTVSAGSER
ncbi:hypothetical protein [Haloarchaeobius sp. DFWS5]|uniref:hypothetical protein n=1 Tax=Haloarchaeobius sp. DFWS5 TaxID=3446114 RepID=UPI003EBDEC18